MMMFRNIYSDWSSCDRGFRGLQGTLRLLKGVIDYRLSTLVYKGLHNMPRLSAGNSITNF